MNEERAVVIALPGARSVGTAVPRHRRGTRVSHGYALGVGYEPRQLHTDNGVVTWNERLEWSSFAICSETREL